MSKHTPGRWKAILKKYDEYHFVTDESGQIGIAQICKYDADAQTEANAHLIAAAPELLEALKAAVEILKDMGEVNLPGGFFEAIDIHKKVLQIKSAIKKAEGRK